MDPMQGGGMGGMIQQVLSQLMQNPAAMQGMQNFMQGLSPTAGMPMPPSQGGAPMPMPMPSAPPGGMPGDMPMPGAPPGEMPAGGPGDAEQMAQDTINSAGDWEGSDEPTSGDLAKLKENPDDATIQSFNAHFGEGAAEEYLGAESGESEEASDAEKYAGDATDEESDKGY